MYLIVVLFIWTLLGVVFVDWGSWNLYYPTILYYQVSNLLYNYIYNDHRLWAYRSVTWNFLNHTTISTAFIFIILPIAFFIFLQHFPSKRKYAVPYILAWTLLFWLIEIFFLCKNMFIHAHGWNIWHTLWFDTLMFTFIYLHHIRPLLTILLSMVAIGLFLYFFPIPFSKLAGVII